MALAGAAPLPPARPPHWGTMWAAASRWVQWQPHREGWGTFYETAAAVVVTCLGRIESVADEAITMLVPLLHGQFTVVCRVVVLSALLGVLS
jgi:hypothetical protein